MMEHIKVTNATIEAQKMVVNSPVAEDGGIATG